MNRKTRIAAAVFSLLIPFAAVHAQETKIPEPNIEFDKTTLDFGKLWDPTKATQHVTISNTGDADLHLTSLSSTCGCTVPKIGDAEIVKAAGTAINVIIAPGESVVMDITVNTFGKRDQLDQEVTVKSNDPDTPESKVAVTGFVEPQVRVSPWLLDLGQLEKGQSVSHVVAVTTREQTFKISRISFGGNRSFKSKKLEPENVVIEGHKRIKANIEVLFKGSTKPGTNMVEATLRTNHPQQRLITMRIKYEILGDLEMPKVIQLGQLEPGTNVQRTFTVASRTGQPFKVLNVRPAAENGSPIEFSATPNDVDNPTSYDVTVVIGNAPARGSMRGSLVVATDVVDEEEIEVRFQGIVLGGPPK